MPETQETRDACETPVPVRIAKSHDATIQNLGLAAGIVIMVVTGHVPGMHGLIALLALGGFVAWPAIRNGGGSAHMLVGSVGVLTAIAEVIGRWHSLIPFVVFAVASLLHGCASLPAARDTLNEMQSDATRAGEALLPARGAPQGH